MRRIRSVWTLALASMLVMPGAVSAEGSRNVRVVDGTGDLVDKFDGTPMEGPDFTDLIGFDVSLVDDTLRLRFDVAEPVPTTLPNGMTAAYMLRLDTDGDSSPDLSVNIGSPGERWLLWTFDFASVTSTEIARLPSLDGASLSAEVSLSEIGSPSTMRFRSEVQGSSAPAEGEDSLDFAFWTDTAPDDADTWVSFDDMAVTSEAPTQPNPRPSPSA
jgi:hypothetical protein